MEIELIRTVRGPVLLGKTPYSVTEQRVHVNSRSSYVEFAVMNGRTNRPHMVFDTEIEAVSCLDAMIENRLASDALDAELNGDAVRA